MTATVESASDYVVCGLHERELLDSPARPIVLLRKRSSGLSPRIAPGNPNLGVMLASAPLHYLLLQNPALPVLVMTSGNVSGQPIAFRNETALAQLFEVADLVLHHDRDIETGVDDSVIRCSSHPELKRPLISFIRRARGYAPYPVEMTEPLHRIVAYGAELKTTVALTQGSRVFMSQHIGDLKNDETFAAHQTCIEHLRRLYEIAPAWVACDMHPSFRSTRFAEQQGEARIIRVQHHHAHMASCMAEHGLQGLTLGVIFDGAGFGSDQTIWGGEFLLGGYDSVRRVAHLRTLPLLGGDKAVHEPWRIAFALAAQALGNDEHLCDGIPALRALDAQQLHVMSVMFRRGINSVPTSSMGRLFDGVAALLGICTQAEYEAHGPIAMEALLERDMRLAPCYAYSLDDAEGAVGIDPAPLIRALLNDVRAGTNLAQISRRFHSTIVDIVCAICLRMRQAHAVQQIVLSGGVFLNEFLLVNALLRLQALGFSAYCHRTVPTNDGGIALGQVMVAHSIISRAHGTP
jgi:hydrogenase maturation protein HypF